MRTFIQHTRIFVLLLLACNGHWNVYSQALSPVNDSVARHKVDSLVVISRKNVKAHLWQEAMSPAREGYNLASRIEYHEGMGDALMVLGEIEYANERPGPALRHYFTAMREYEWVASAEKQARTAWTIADIFKQSGLHDKALEYYNKSLEIGDSLLSREETGAINERMAEVYLDLGQYDRALPIFEELYRYYAEYGSYQTKISALNQLTHCLYALNRYDDALQYNIQALDLSRKSGNQFEEMAALNNLGYTWKYLGDPEKALGYFQQASETGIKLNAPLEEITVTLTNMAIIYQIEQRYRESLDHFFRAEAMAEKAGNQIETSRIKHLIALTYYITRDYHNARVYNNQALSLAIRAGDEELAARTYLTSSNISAALYDWETSMAEYRHYLSIRDSIAISDQGEKQDIAQQQYLVERTEKELDEVLYTRQVERLELNQLRLETEKKEQDLILLKKTAELQEATIMNQELEKNRAIQELLLAEEKLAAERKDREIKDLKVQQQLQESELRRSELETIRQKQEIRVLTQEKLISDLNLKRVRARTRFLAVIVLLAMVSLVIIIRSWRFARKTNKTLAHQRNKIQQQKEAIESQYDLIKIEREKSEKLLLNILPLETAAELKEKGFASPQHYEMVTVLFTDFVGFTQVSEKMTPREIVRELDYCFFEFDKIIDRHNLEKIKTIGDSYMCAGGIPVANDTNPFDVVYAALEIRDFMDKARKARESKGEAYWQLRIGVNTGPVVAGVVGKNKFAYDIWGDAVNTASRMESSGEAGKVNISGNTYELVRNRFECSYRGKVKAKNKGEIDMYFVDGKKKVSK